MTLAGKVALVTGSSQGIGQGIVLRLAQAEADVVINYCSHPEGAEETLKQVKAIEGKCYLAACPNSQADTVQADLGSVNLKGVFFATQAFVTHFLETKRPSKIINISSVHEDLSFPISRRKPCENHPVRISLKHFRLILLGEI